MSLGNYLGNTLSGQQEDNQSLVHEGGDIPKIIYPVEEIELAVDTVITQTDWSASKSFILGHPINGILGSPNLGMGGGQIVLGDDGNSVTTTLVQRRWIWETVTQLEEGTADANIDLQNGDIRLNI